MTTPTEAEREENLLRLVESYRFLANRFDTEHSDGDRFLRDEKLKKIGSLISAARQAGYAEGAEEREQLLKHLCHHRINHACFECLREEKNAAIRKGGEM